MRQRDMRMTNAWGRALLPLAAAAILAIVALAAWGAGVFGCREGTATPFLTLLPTYAQTHPEATQIRLCVRGGGCATAALKTDATATGPATSPAGQQSRTRPVSAMQFGRLIPARIAKPGPDGGPLHLTATVYGRSGPILSASATLSPMRRAPASKCELRGYTVLAQLTPGGTLRYYPIA